MENMLRFVRKAERRGRELSLSRRSLSKNRHVLPGDACRGRSPFIFNPQAGACTPPRSDFLYVRKE